ncbi:MAG: hypothetical protein LUD22_03295 [Coprobacillus sp.]|nr:hypothetical protein [Coprobacillus sp.]
MLSLLAKDFRLLFAGRGTRRNRIISYTITILLVAIFVALEVYLFQNILSKLMVYSTSTCLTFFNIFLFVIAIIMTFITLGVAKRLFFNNSDNSMLMPYPISGGAKVVSKLIMLFLTCYAFNFVVNYPLFIAYGLIVTKGAWFYYLALFYPILIFFVEAGVAFILLYPYKLLLDYLQRHVIIQFIGIVIVAVLLCIAYGYFLNFFISAISSSSLSSVFTRDTLTSMRSVGDRLFPTNILTDIFVNGSFSMILPYLGIAIGIFIIGLAVVIFFYNGSIRKDDKRKSRQNGYTFRQSSPTWALIRKELILLFRNSTFVMTFTGILVVEPLLAYFVVQGVNVIFTSSSLAYISFIIPNLVPVLDTLLMMLTVVIIAQGTNNFIINEDKNVRVMKTIPVSASRQLIIKVSIPFIMSFFFCFISFVVLIAAGLMSITLGAFSFILCAVLLAIVSLVSLYEQLRTRRNKATSHLLTYIYSYLIPIVYFVVAVAFCYIQLNIYLTYFISLLFIVAVSIPFLIRPRKRINNLYQSLEVSN